MYLRVSKRKLFSVLIALLVGFVLLCDVADAKQDDEAISNAIESAMMFDQAVNSNWIDVEVDNGVVTLSGTVKNLLAKERAVRLTRTVKGVVSVIDRINIEAPPVSDGELRGDVKNALLWDPATEAYEIDVDVRDGTVILDGQVDSWDEKELAAKVVKGVRGVEQIINDLNFEYEATRSDTEIRQEVDERLKWDAYIDDGLVDVKVDDGIVYLSGTVGSAAEKRRAIADAWTTGVMDVKVKDLEVRDWARDEKYRKDKFVKKDDEEIEDAVERAFLYDPRVNMFKIDVSSSARMVTLSGVVDNLKAKRAAEMDAKNTVGVWKVKNNIKVRPMGVDLPVDNTIENRVEKSLANDPYVSQYNIDVEVIDNVAYLDGEVNTYFEKGQADDVASKVYGVAEVENNIVIEKDYEAMTYDPYMYSSWSIYGYPWYTYPSNYISTETDWDIEKDIESELWWSPFVDEEEVEVYVEDGVATLKGEVDTWNEYLAARENAIEGGAVSVKNRLDVDYDEED
jgi:osmotically-inducible protein OsmY